MNDLVLDVKCCIAKLDETVWYKLYLYDDDFKKYSKSKEGINLFKHLFTKQVDFDGRIEYRLCKKRHRDIEPAIIYRNGRQEWYQCGKLHRDYDLPAVISSNGTQYWCKRGKLHRENLPAIVYLSGIKEYYRYGKRLWVM